MIFEILTILSLPIMNLLRPGRNSIPNHILIIQAAKIGDYVNSSFVIAALRKTYANAHISILISEINKPLASCNKNIDSIYIYRKSGYHGLRGRVDLSRLIRSSSADLIISLNYSAVISTAAAFSVASCRLGIMRPKKSLSTFITRLLWDHTITHRPERLIHQSYNDLLQYCGASQNQPDIRNSICHNKSYESIIDNRFNQDKKILVGIGVSSANKLKELPTHTIIEIVRRIYERQNTLVLLIGGTEDKPKASVIIQSADGVIDTTGDYRIDEIPYLMQKLSLFIGVDSGLTYIADATGIPVISISGPCNMSETRPLHTSAQLIQNLSLPCMPCSYIHSTANKCRIDSPRCILDIPIEQILASAQRLLKRPSI